MPRKKKPVNTNYDLQGTWELHYVSYFLRVFKKLFNLKKSYIAELLEKEISYDATQIQFGEEIAKIVEYLTGEECPGATSWERVLEEQMSKNAVHPNILKGTNFNSLDPEQRLQLLKILVDLVREVKDEDISEFGRNLKSKSLRFKAVGKDKDENKYWTFGSSRLFREFSKPNSRRFESVCTTPSEWEGFILTLRPSPNKNEKDLHKSLKHVWGKIKDHIQLTQLKMKGHLELSQMAVKEHFELKRQAEAIEAIESDLEKPKMTKLMKMNNKPSKHKHKEKDGIVSPMYNSRPVFQNGFNKASILKKKKFKPKLKKQDDHIRTKKMKENVSHTNNNCTSKKEEAVTKKPKFFEDHNSMMSDSMLVNKDEDDPPLSEELRRKIAMDDPGIDLSVFKPLGKRKCVIEMEERKGKTWYEGDDDASEDDLHVGDYLKDKEVPKKKKRKKLKSLPTASPAPIISDPPVLKTAASDNKTYVFSTALANRGAYEVIIKGKFNTIIAYHQAQKWATPYLQHHVHCEPFVPEELKNEPNLYTSDDGSIKSYKSSEEEYVKANNAARKKPIKKPRRKFSDASASISSPASIITNQSSDRNEREVSLTSRNTENSERESLSSDRENSDDDEYSTKHHKHRIGNNHVNTDDSKMNNSKSSTKRWKDIHPLGIEERVYQDYHRYLYNNNRNVDMQPKSFFSPGNPNYRPFTTQGRGQNPLNAKEANKQSSKPRPSPLNQPTALSSTNHIQDELSEDDDDDDEDDEEEESPVSESENGKEEETKGKGDQNNEHSPRETDMEFKTSLENIPDQPVSPTSSKHSLSDISLSSRDREKQIDQLPDSLSNVSPTARNSQQTASVISSTKSNSVTPLRISTPSEALSRSPRDSPQLSPFAAYRGRPATYPAEIVNPKPGTIRSPARFGDAEKQFENEMKSSEHCSDLMNNPSSLVNASRPTTLYLGNRASPMQQSHVTAYGSVSEQKPQVATNMHQKSPQVVDTSVIHRSDPSPASLDNLCSPAIPMHQANSAPVCKTSSNSPIVINDTVNGNARAMSPVSPAAGSRSSVVMTSNVYSAVSPVIANHIRSSPSFPTQNCPTIQAISSASANCVAQRIPSPLHPSSLHSQRMPHHANQADPNALASLYRQHSRMARLPAGMKAGIRGPSPVVDEPARISSMIHTQQARAFQGLPIAMPKEASQLSRAYAQAGQEPGRAFHSISAHGSQDLSRSIHSQQHGMPDTVKAHITVSRNSLLSHAHNSQEQVRSFLGLPSSIQDASRSQHGIPRPGQTSPRLHLGLSLSSQDSSRTILGMTQSAQEATRNVLGISHNNLESSRIHHSGSHSAQETPRSHHAVPHNPQELTRSHNALTHAMHEQSRYAAAMPHSFHHSLNRNLHDSSHARSLHDVAHGVRPGMQGHSFQQGMRNLPESPVGKSPPTQSLFHHSHGREFASAAGMKSYPTSSLERTMMEFQQSRLLEQQQARMLEQQQQQTRKSFSVESLTASSEANERSKGQCINGQPTTPSALSRPGYSPSQRTHMFAHYAAYPRGPPAEFFKLPPHVQQMYAARGGLGPYMNFAHFKG